MDLGLAGKKAIITGGTKGIGRAIADLLADEGADVGICARHEGEVDQAVAALAAKGVNATGAAVGYFAAFIDCAIISAGGNISFFKIKSDADGF